MRKVYPKVSKNILFCRKRIEDLKVTHDISFKNHVAIRPVLNQKPELEHTSRLRPLPFKKTKYMNKLAKKIKKKIQTEEQFFGNLLKHHNTEWVSSEIAQYMQVMCS